MHHDNSSADTEQANKQSFDAVEECNQAHWNHVVNRKASYGTEFTSVGPGNTVLGTVVQGLEKFFVHYPRSNYPVQNVCAFCPNTNSENARVAAMCKGPVTMVMSSGGEPFTLSRSLDLSMIPAGERRTSHRS